VQYIQANMCVVHNIYQGMFLLISDSTQRHITWECTKGNW